jgi:hypothetical protein
LRFCDVAGSECHIPLDRYRDLDAVAGDNYDLLSGCRSGDWWGVSAEVVEVECGVADGHHGAEGAVEFANQNAEAGVNGAGVRETCQGKQERIVAGLMAIGCLGGETGRRAQKQSPGA